MEYLMMIDMIACLACHSSFLAKRKKRSYKTESSLCLKARVKAVFSYLGLLQSSDGRS